MLRRHFTVMVLPDAHLRLRRYHLRGGHLIWAVAGVAALLLSALSAPVLGVWALNLSRELKDVRQDRDRLGQRSLQVEETIGELRQKIAEFEKQTEKLAFIAGLEMSHLGRGGQGANRSLESMEPQARADLLKSEALDLADRGSLLGSRMDLVEKALDQNRERGRRLPALLPVRGLLGSGFGWRRDPFTGLRQFHRGIDISAPRGTPIIAPADGLVTSAGRHSGFGNLLVVSHGDGVVTTYGHLAAFKVQPGQKVQRGQVIALVGSSGRSTSSHLHYEVHQNGKEVDPSQYILNDEGLE